MDHASESLKHWHNAKDLEQRISFQRLLCLAATAGQAYPGLVVPSERYPCWYHQEKTIDRNVE